VDETGVARYMPNCLYSVQSTWDLVDICTLWAHSSWRMCTAGVDHYWG